MTSRINFNQLLELAKVTSQAAPIQAVILGFSFATGLLIINFLPPEDYALYTIAYSFLSAIVVIADGGMGSAVSAEGGKVWQDPNKLGRVIITGMALRLRISAITVILALPVMAYFLGQHGASGKEIFFLALAIMPILYIRLSADLLSAAPSLHQKVTELQSISLITSGLRLLLLALTLFTLPYAALVILMTGAANYYQLWKVRKISKSLCELDQKEDPEVRKNMLAVTKRMMPQAIYTCLSGTLSIWLISLFGNTQSVAEVGAIERVARLLLIVSALFSLIIEPRFARLSESNPSLLRTRFLQLYAFAWVVGGSIALGIYLFPQPIAFLLGSGYQNINHEIQLRGLVMGLIFVSNMTTGLASSRAWIVPPVPLIAGQIVSQVIAIIVFDCSTTAGVLLIPVFPFSVMLAMRTYYSLHSIRKLEQARETN